MADLHDKALELARVHLSDGDMLPFALVVGSSGMTCTTIVTERSDTAMVLGRRMIRGEREVDAYALCVDAFLRIGGERRDAVFLEVGSRGERTASVTVHPYTRAGGFAFDAPRAYERRPSALHDFDPLELDWGATTLDKYSEQRKLAVHVVNHELGTADDVARTVRFVRARIRFQTRHVPPGTGHLVYVEDRERPIHAREALRAGLGKLAEVVFASERR